MLADLFLAGLAGLVGLLLGLVTLASYTRSRHPRLLFVAIAFLVFAAKDLWTTWALYSPDRMAPPSLTTTLAADILMIALLYAALAQRARAVPEG